MSFGRQFFVLLKRESKRKPRKPSIFILGFPGNFFRGLPAGVLSHQKKWYPQKRHTQFRDAMALPLASLLVLPAAGQP